MAKPKPIGAFTASIDFARVDKNTNELFLSSVAETVESPACTTPFLVKKAFGDFRIGNVIADPALIEKILASPQASFIIPMESN